MTHVIPAVADNINRLVKNSIDFHCHGIGQFDFTEINDIRLDEIQQLLGSREQKAILTLYLPELNFKDFLALMAAFSSLKNSGRLQNIAGFALEGPLLSSRGGTPQSGIWMPTKQHWREIAACGKDGLIYMVLSPDVVFSNNDPEIPNNISWVAETLLKGGVLPAPGHFKKDNPTESARLLQEIFDVVARWGHGPTITDHLFNDMPLNFKHAWRTPEEKTRREQDIKALNLDAWNLSSLEETLGIVPATIIKNAKKGLVKICQNFDGEHVDLKIIKRAVELIGAENIVVMTDSIESKRLAGRTLHTQPDSTLLYQDNGIVAAGSQTMRKQIENMLFIGLSDEEIMSITNRVPSMVLAHRKKYILNHCNSLQPSIALFP
jgi:N-acetylglucosamine-6-phosphate deacetylase